MQTALYLAKQFVAKKGFDIRYPLEAKKPAAAFDIPPEAEKLAAACDIFLASSDGYSLSMICMIDREARPEGAFPLPVEEVREIGAACLRYTGSISSVKMPVLITIIEVGATSAEQLARLQQFKPTSRTSKVILTGMTVDTITKQVWNSSRPLIGKGIYRRFIEKVLAAPREADADLAPPAPIALSGFPTLTVALLVSLAAIFAMEIVFGIGQWTGPLQPTIETLVGFGGLERSLVQAGEWRRLILAPFLHADAFHLAMNGLALYIAGMRLERLIGRAWFGAMYVVGALCGSLASLAFNSPSIVSVGASGAIMGLFAAMVVASWRLPVGIMRTQLQMNAVYVLIPSLLPFAAPHGEQIDYAGHLGGAIGGAIAAMVMLKVWPRTALRPDMRRVAATVALVGLFALGYSSIAIVRHFPATVIGAQFIPPGDYPETSAEWSAKAAELVKQYPHDPRGHLMYAVQLLDANDHAGAEREARTGLEEKAMWNSALPELSTALTAVLAVSVSLDGARRSEAISIAQPICHIVDNKAIRALLDSQRLCHQDAR